MSPEVEEAMRRGRWGEIVTIETTTTADGCDNADSVSLTPRLDINHGGFVWNPIPSHLVLPLFLRTKQWIFPMLNDHERNRLYQRAIGRAISQRFLDQTANNQEGGEHDADKDDKDDKHQRSPAVTSISALDVGCGTALWGMVAARALREALREETTRICNVCSIDMSNFMVQIAQHVVHDNQLSSRVQVKEVHSTDLNSGNDSDDNNNKGNEFHLCVSELLEHGLLGEGWLPTMRNLWQTKVIPADATVIPSGATVFAQAVQTNELATTTENKDNEYEGWAAELRGPHTYRSAKYDALTMSFPSEMQQRGTDSVVRLPVHAAVLVEQGRLTILSEPQVPILDISVEREALLHHHNAPVSSRHVRTLKISQTGRLDGIMVAWDLHLLSPSLGYYNDDRDSQLTYSLNRNSAWQDHWRPVLHVLEEPIQVIQGESYSLQAWHDDERIHVSVMEDASDQQPTKRVKHAENSDSESSLLSEPPLLSTLRLRQLNNHSRLNTLERGVELALQNILKDEVGVEELVVLDVSDFCLSSLLAAQVLVHTNGKQGKLQRCSMFSIECSQGLLPVLSAQAAQINLPSAMDMTAGNLKLQFQVVQCHPEKLSCSVLFPKQAQGADKDGVPRKVVDLLVAEPYFEMTEAWPLLSAMNFYNLVQQLKRTGVVSVEHTQIVPARANVMACAISSPDLFQAYRLVLDDKKEESILGLNHSFVNQQRRILGDGTVLALPMWQYRYDKLSAAVQLTSIPYKSDCTESVVLSGSAELEIVTPASCHGVVVWTEYEMGKAGLELSTLSECEHQLVVLLDNTIEAPIIECRFQLSGCFDSRQNGNCGTDFQFQISQG